MAVEERRSSMDENEPNDNFPVGMRVLVVDDDHTCLLVLERMLRQCEYHATTTTQAVMALQMLRENRNKFDLIISDVHMPDMDGFKLLEQVGLEMDLPVIMMSGNGDTKSVMKGITHGACDYLIKPVRIEELRNIWQHVIRKKKSKGPSNSDNSENPHQGTSEGGQASSAAGNADRNKVNRKRKDQEEDEDEDEDYDESGQENDDPSAQKKPRVVWSVELHRKFVAAVNQLGIDKAVPKKILDFMNVERLTRENVASHLQKYRLYLKRISSVASQQANMVAALGGKESPYLRMASLDGMGDFHMMNGSGHLPNAAFPSFSSGAMLGRLNSPANLAIRGLSSSGMIQLGQSSNSTNAYNDISKLQSTLLTGNQNGNLLKGIPTSLDLSHLQQNKFISHPGEFNPIGNSSGFPLSSSGFPDSGVTIGSSTNSFNVSNNRLPLRGNLHQVQSQGSLGNQPSVGMPLNNSEPFGIRNVSAPVPDRCTDNWQGTTTIPGFSSNSLPVGDLFDHADLTPGNIGDNKIAPLTSNLRNNTLDSSPSSIPSLHDSRRDAQMQGSLVGIGGQLDNLKPTNYGSMSNRISPNMNYSMQQTREENRRDYMQNSNLLFNSVNTSLPMHATPGSFGQHFGQENAVHNRNMDSTLLSQSSSSNPFVMQQNGFESSSLDPSMRMKGEFHMDQTRSQSGFMNNSSGSLEDLMHAMIKREDPHDLMSMDGGDIGGNIYPVRTCI